MSEGNGTLDRQTEQTWIAQAMEGHEDAVRALVDAHQERLYSFIWRIARNHHDAEEICQDAFLKAFASLHSFSTKYRFSTWLFTIGYRVCLNRMRRKRMLTGDLEWAEIPQVDNDAAAEVAESEDASRLKQAVWSSVDRLSMPQRASIILFYRHALGCQEIARVLELPVATVKSHLHRARSRLREMLEPLANVDWEEFRNRSLLAG